MTSQSNRLPADALIVLATIGYTAITTELLPSGLLPQISADFLVSEATAGYLTAGYAAIIVVTVTPLSMLLSRVPRHFLLVALMGGIAHGLLWSAMAPFVARIVPAHKVGKALAIGIGPDAGVGHWLRCHGDLQPVRHPPGRRRVQGRREAGPEPVSGL